MSLFAIRDDDTSFFTSPEEIDAVYGPYWGSVPISLATVPFSCPEHQGRSFGPDFPADSETPIGENVRLINWLNTKIHTGEIEIMLHGYSHQYRKVKGPWIGEFRWKTGERLITEVSKGKAYLESLFSIPIKIFVPPGNAISKDGMVAVCKAGLHLSGIIGLGNDRPFTLDYLAAYIKRWGWWILNKNGLTAYPFVLEYGTHKELRAYALTPSADADQLIRNLEHCVQLGAPFVVATHYWEFRECPEMKDTLKQLIQRARDLNMTFVPVSRCFEG